AAPEALRQVRDAAERVAADHPGARVEDKGIALALHWRAAPAARAALEAIAAAALPGLPGYRLQYGNCVVELRPSHADKGQAVQRLMGCEPFVGRLPVYAGDDLTDEDAFAATNALGGVSVRVGHREPSYATHTLADTAALRAWVSEAAARLGAHA
ncbi:MAG TPA: trehalose-phosphatase, partial [Lysobacter sp.]